jgi:hypothetical protein
MENRKKSIEELQAELTLEAEALATLQLIYAEKVKQVRVNTLLPPDIQARFLSEWETFYQQRMTAIFRKDYLVGIDHSSIRHSHTAPSHSYAGTEHSSNIGGSSEPMLSTETPPTPVAVMPSIASSPAIQSPVLAPVAPVAPVMQQPNQVQPVQAQALSSSNRPVASNVVPPLPPPLPSTPPITPPVVSKRSEPMQPSLPQIQSSSIAPQMSANSMVNQEPPLTDDILGVNTGSWMNPAESIGYEQYSDNEPISSTLMDSDKIQSSTENSSSYDSSYDASYDEEIDESDSIDGFAATSGLKGLTEFMDFDLKRKKS